MSPDHVLTSVARAEGEADGLAVSIVVIGYAPASLLLNCVSALQSQVAGRSNVEVIVVAPKTHQGTALGPIHAVVPEFLWLEAPPAYNVARMRGLGIARSRAPIIAMIEGDCMPSANWVARVLEGGAGSAIGGAVEPAAFSRGIDWAAYFCEFAKFMRPLPTRVHQLPGANVVYERAVLPEPAHLESEGFYETFVNASVGGRHTLAYDADLVVVNHRRWSIRGALRTRFHHGRGYAALRVANRSLGGRLPFMATSFVLPWVLSARVMGEIWRRRRFVIRSIIVLPWIVALSVTWSVGELLGYGAGPGSSLEQWR